jgi:tetratricopeptide (TPR) repeat protein
LGIAGCDGDIDEMDRCIEIMQSLAERLDQPTLKWMDSFQRSGRALIAGDVDQAEQLATTALQIANESGEPDAELMFGAQVMCVSWQRGTMGDLVPLIEQMAADNPGVPTITAALATAHAEGNRITESRNMLETFAATGFDMPLDMSWFMGIVCYAEAAIACQDPKYAMPLFERLAPWADQWSSNDAVVGGPASTFLGGLAAVLGRYDQAEVHFAQAALSCSRVGAKFFAARTDLSWGRMLAERQAPGDIEKAREMFAKALTVAEAHGYGNVERRAAAALRDLG